MTIEEFLEKSALTQKEFGALFGCTQGAVGQWIRGQAKPHPTTAMEIERYTAGQITREELRPDIDWSRPASLEAVPQEGSEGLPLQVEVPVVLQVAA